MVLNVPSTAATALASTGHHRCKSNYSLCDGQSGGENISHNNGTIPSIVFDIANGSRETSNNKDKIQ